MSSRLIEAAGAGRAVLTPSTELAAALFDAVERAHLASGRDVWPTPQVRDFGGWLKERHIRHQLDDASTPRCLSDVEERELWRDVVLSSESSREFLEPSGAARAARQARRAMHEYGIPIAAIAAYGSAESQALLDWNERFVERCRALHCISADELLGWADRTPHGGARGGAPPAWIDSPLWRPMARRWLEHNAGPPLPPAVPEPYAAQATVVTQSGRPRSFAAASPAAELAAMAQWAHEHLQMNPAFRAWVCIRDLAARRAEVVDALDAVLAPQRFALQDAQEGAAYAVAGGTALAEYAPVRAALEFLSVCGGPVSFDRFSALLRSPELQASAAEASAAARLDMRLRRRAPSEARLAEWLALAEREAGVPPEPVAALLRLGVAARAIEGLRGHHPMSRWLPIWIAALEAGPWALRHRWSSAEFQSAERLRELLATLALGEESFGALSRRSAEQILERAARETSFQMQTGVPPIWISGQLSDPWLAYEGLWVTGCDDERWPPPADPIPLLPVVLQRKYGVSAASGQLEFALDLQRRWLARARTCVFSRAAAGENRAAVLSPLLASLAPEPLHPASMQPQPAPHWAAQRVHAPLLEELSDEQAPLFGAEEKTRGIATLRAQSRCAFRGFAETRLAAEVLERPQPGFNERERGELLHDALQRIWTEVRDSTRLNELVSQEDRFTQLLDASAVAALAKLCERRDPGRRWRERERARLNGLLRRWLELEGARPPFRVERLEEGAQTAHHAGLAFTVRVDRIDRLPDGARVLIDYKSGAAGADWRLERPDNPQLPVYALLHREDLVAVAYGRVNAAECTFVVESERGGIFPGRRRSRMEGMASFAELLQVWEQRIEKLAREFGAGRAAVDPTPSACRSCRLHGLCRVPSALEASTVVAAVAEAP